MEATCETCGRVFEGPRARQALGAHRRTHQPKKRSKKAVGVEPTDLLRLVFPNGVPVEHLDVAQDWLNDTQAFLIKVR